MKPFPYNCSEENRSTESGGGIHRKDKNREPVQHYIPATEGSSFPNKENPFYPYPNLNSIDRSMDGRHDRSNHDSDVDNHYRDAFGYPSHSRHPQQQQYDEEQEVSPYHNTHSQHHQQDMHRQNSDYEHETNGDRLHHPYPSPMVDDKEIQHVHNEQKMEEEDIEHDGPPNAPYPPPPGFFYPYPPPPGAIMMPYPPPPGAMVPGPPPPGAMIPGPPPPGAVMIPGPPPPGAMPGPPPPGAVMMPYPPFPGYPIPPPPPYYASKEYSASFEDQRDSDPISGADKADTSSRMQYNTKNVTKGTSQRARKNARARIRANRLKEEVEVIKKKPANQRTQEEIEKMTKFEAQRNEKNRKLREKARAKKKAYLEISKKKESERTEEERKLVKSILLAKAKKSKDDRLRRIRQRGADNSSIGDSNASTSAFISRSFSIQESFTEDGDRDDYLPPPPPESGTMPLYADQRQHFPLGNSLRDKSKPPSTVSTYERQAAAFYNPDLPATPHSSSLSASKERGLSSTSEHRAVSFHHLNHDDNDEYERSLSPINIEEESRPVASSRPRPQAELAVETGFSPSSWPHEFSPSMFDQSPAMRNMHISRIDEGNEGRLKRGASDASR